ncbi:hypothetical protein GGR51DRAFT_878 [Nemania sp. FL0031]|nr:hypothetical protein GGR51DRAFT_878 [Nemania sp. FL0031]
MWVTGVRMVLSWAGFSLVWDHQWVPIQAFFPRLRLCQAYPSLLAPPLTCVSAHQLRFRTAAFDWRAVESWSDAAGADCRCSMLASWLAVPGLEAQILGRTVQ